MDIFIVDLNNPNLDDVNFYAVHTENIIHVRLLVCHNRYKQRKVF